MRRILDFCLFPLLGNGLLYSVGGGGATGDFLTTEASEPFITEAGDHFVIE